MAILYNNGMFVCLALPFYFVNFFFLLGLTVWGKLALRLYHAITMPCGNSVWNVLYCIHIVLYNMYVCMYVHSMYMWAWFRTARNYFCFLLLQLATESIWKYITTFMNITRAILVNMHALLIYLYLCIEVFFFKGWVDWFLL